jgi:alpha-glucosidase
MSETAAQPRAQAHEDADAWWREGVLYQIYPRSFADSDGDGIGDLRGIIDRLDHLEWLGVQGIWLNPVMPSPNQDWGYDVADYCAVDPDLGTVADVEELAAQAGARGIRVIFDLVPNHTSDQHAWFVEARESRDAPHRDFYVWADGRADGEPPNNWLSGFGGPAWEYDERTGQWFLHNFLPSQPDLNWWNDEVREAFDDILRFWFDRGVAGFRIDVTHAIVKDRELRDNPATTPEDHHEVQKLGQRQVFSMNRPEVHEVLRRWRALADAQEPRRILVGETYVLDLDHLMTFYGNGSDELHMAFNFLFVWSPFDAGRLRTIVEGTEALLPAGGWPVWTGSNHDVGRMVSRWCGGDERKARCALLALLTLRGTPFLYYGDEIGMPEPAIAPADERDPVGRTTGHPERNRDGCRTPMQWSPGEGAGFTAPGVRPWLPFGDHAECNVADQREDPASIVNLCRELIALRRGRGELRRGAYAPLPGPAGTWAWRRGDALVVALNLSDAEASVPDVMGTVVISSDRMRDGETVDGQLALAPWQGAVVEASG